MKTKPNKKSKWRPCPMCSGKIIQMRKQSKNKFRCKDCGAIIAAKEEKMKK